MNAFDQHQYHEGFIDGQMNVVDAVVDIVHSSDSRTEAYESIVKFIDDLKAEIDSL